MEDTNWSNRWISLAQLVSGWSKDKSRKTGCVIVDNRQVLISIGWNGFPRKINDNIEARYQRPQKYKWTEHAERNAIYNAAAKGNAVLGCTMYLTWYPCADCARAIIQSGIYLLVGVEPDWNDEIWKEDFQIVKEMLGEANIKVAWEVLKEE